MSLSITAVPSRDQSAVEAGVASGLFLLFRLITVMINDTFTTKGKKRIRFGRRPDYNLDYYRLCRMAGHFGKGQHNYRKVRPGYEKRIPMRLNMKTKIVSQASDKGIPQDLLRRPNASLLCRA